ncbi:aminoglycoside resistance protein [Enterobacter cloacae subsp. cloacae]|uniref:aminoglycoside adenylyltransferase family protein n=1 Tax=Enterobacter cloacae TaxID=550 RepID=UPI00063AF96B|nr:aminoglycoside adenylyltransferase family protein [Enterobacter cloacae]KLG12607.1 aminoglycoside resistance protein [Enterobacter cloacae subsp. cloacae]
MNVLPCAQKQIQTACAFIESILGRELMAIHLYGSAMDGGLKPLSDIDLLVTVRSPLRDEQRHTLMQKLLAISAWPGTSEIYRALEVTVVVWSQIVPWQFPPMRELQFGEWLREEIANGEYEPAQPDPDLAILLTKVRQHSLPLRGEAASTLFEAVPERDLQHTFRQTLALWNGADDLEGDERHILLTLARIGYSVETGKIASKDEAAAWLLPQLPEAHAKLLAEARAEYLGLVTVDWAEKMPQIEAFVRDVKKTILEKMA